jgi:hypothetical protein
MDYVEDPAGVLASDAHRHVLGHMALPSDQYGWPERALRARLIPSVTDPALVTQILNDLFVDDLAERSDGAWRMTQAGYEALTGPIANEPAEGASARAAAQITMARPIAKATP